MENRFEIQGNSLIIHLPKEVDHNGDRRDTQRFR